jgi:predicted lipoprotein
MRMWSCLVLAVLVASCSVGPSETEVVQSMTDLALVPSLAASSRDAAELSAAVAVFCAEPTEANKAMAQVAWRLSKETWERAFLTTWFGPAQLLRTVSRVDYQPVSEEGIEELLASAEMLDADYVLNQAAATVRGLGSIEYLLFDSLDHAADVRVCELMRSTAEVVASETLALQEAWTESYQEGSPFVERFAGEGMETDDALADVVSAIVETLKQQTLFELGKALGISAQEAAIEAIPEGRAGHAAGVYLGQLEAIRSVLDEGGETSLGALIRSRSEETSALIDEHLSAAMEGLEAIERPLREIAADDPGRLDPLYESLSELLRIFEADVVSLLDITLGFSDADGDSG